MSRGKIGTIISTSIPNLVGHWKFQEGPGMTAQDYSGACRHGKIFGAKYVSDYTGNHSALQFDGEKSFVLIPNYNPKSSSTHKRITNLSFLFGFKGYSSGNGGVNGYSCGIISHSINDTKNGWWIEWRNSGDLELGTFVSGVYTPFTIQNNFNDTSSWHILKGNICANGPVKVFLDNNLKVDSRIGNWRDSTISDFVVGKGTSDISNNPNATNQYFNGMIGEIMIFNSIQ
jgi:hypothetical protein